jgi:uncharacterized repeat protein (TIGR01451 family)
VRLLVYVALLLGVSSATSPIAATATDAAQTTASPAISIAGTAAPATYSASGDTIRFTFTVTNDGGVFLHGVMVTGSLGGVLCSLGGLVTSAVTRCTADHTVTRTDVRSGRVAATVAAVGDGPAGTSVTATTSVTAVLHARAAPIPRGEINIAKSADVDSFAAAGQRIVYTYRITDTGTVSLRAITVTDSKIGAVSCPGTALAVGASMTCTADYTTTTADVTAGQVTNIATADGTTPAGVRVTDQTDLRIRLAVTLSITKTASVASYDRAGTPITYTYTVTSTFDVALHALTVTDNKIAAVSCPGTVLSAGASMTCTAGYTTTQADVDAEHVANTAIVAGLTPNGDPVGAVDTLVVPAVHAPAIAIAKTANVASFGHSGTPITYTYHLVNTGNVTLSGVTVADDKVANLACGPLTLTPTQQATCTGTYLTTQADVDAGHVANIATATGTPPSGPAVTATAQLEIPATHAPRIAITKSPSTPSFTGPGQPITYTLTVTNDGNLTLHGITVTDNPALAVACPATTLAPGTAMTCTATHVTTVADVDRGSVTDIATATGTPPAGPAVTGTSNTVTVAGPQHAPAISIAKAASTPSFTGPGQLITYTLTVTNDGNVTLHGITVTDNPALAVACPATTLAPGAAMACTAPHVTTVTDVDRGSITDTGTAQGLSPANARVSHTSAAVTVAGPAHAPAISIAKAASTPSFTGPGQPITYTFTVTNTGNVTLTGVTVADSPVLAVNCPGTTLAPGAVMTCTATHVTTVADVDRGSVTDVATATGTPPAGPAVTGTSDTVTVAGPVHAPAISITKSASPSTFTAAGEPITYTFTVTNTGNVTLHGVTVSDAGLPAGAVPGCPPATLAPGASRACAATYVTTVADVDRGFLTDIATATGTPPAGPAVSGTTGTVIVTGPQHAPAISITKTADRSAFTAAGQAITYTFTVTNTGNVTLAGATVTDSGLPAGAVLDCPPVTLAPGAAVTCTATYVTTVADVDRGFITDVATGTGIPPSGPAVTGTSNTVTVEGPAHAPAISIIKTASTPSFTGPGQPITYTFTVTNTGNVTLHADRLADGPGLAVACPATTLAPGAAMACTAAHVTTVADVDRGSVADVATDTATPPSGPAVTGTSNTVTVEGPVHAPAISIAKAVSTPSFTGPGQPITYTLTVTNDGNVTLHGITVTDSGGLAVACPATTLAPGAAMACTGTYVTTVADVDRGFLTDTGTAQSLSPANARVTHTSAAVTVAGPAHAPAISIAKSASTPSFTGPGQPITYMLTVTNDGDVTLHGVTVTDNPALAVACPGTTLAPGAAMTCTATRLTTVADVDRGFITDVATATGTPPAATPVTGTSDTVTVAGPAHAPAISIAKSASTPSFTRPGQLITYTFTVTNHGNVTLAGTTVTDSGLPAGAVLDCPSATLAPGASRACTATYLTTTADADRGFLTDAATATGTPPAGPAVTGTSGTVTVAGPQHAPAISITKTASTPSFTRPGQPITYTFTVTNDGNVTLAGTTVSDSGVPAGAVLDCPPATLAPGASRACTATYLTTTADADRGFLTDIATATGTPPAGPAVTGTSGTVTVAGPQHAPAISITKQANPSSFTGPGQLITYTLTVTNDGNVTLHGITATDNPALAVACPATTLAPGAAMACTATRLTTVADVDRGFLTDSGTALGLSPANARVSHTSAAVTVTGPQHAAAISITKTADRSAFTAAGQIVTYTLTVTNDGNVTLAGATVTDSGLPAGAVLDCPPATLAPGAPMTCTATYVTTVADVDRGFITDIATATGTPPAGPAVTGTSNTVTVTGPVHAPAISIAKTASTPSFTRPGEPITYTFTVTNTGNVTLHGDRLADSPGPAVACPATTLASGAAMTCTATHLTTVADVDRGFITDVATDTGTPPADPAVTGTSNTVTVEGPQHAPAISITKQANRSSFTDTGQEITYTFTVTNTGNVTLAGVTVTDSGLPAAAVLDCPATTLAPGASRACTATYVTTLADVDRGFITDVATATGTPPADPAVTGTSNTVTVTGPAHAPAISITKQANRSAFTAAGQAITYTFTVTNTGNVTLHGVTVADSPGLAVACPATILAPDAAMTCTATHLTTLADVDRGSVTDVATTTGTPSAGPAVTGTSNTVTVEGPQHAPAISITKQADPSSFPDPGQLITYTFTVTNDGNVTLAGVTVSDSGLPAGAVLDCPPASLARGATLTCTATYVTTLADLDRGFITDVATATGTPPAGPAATGTSNPVTVTAVQHPVIEILKKASPTEYHAAGETIRYTFTVINDGNVTLHGITVTDNRLGTISCPPATLAPGGMATCTATHVATNADVDARSIVNTATATGLSPTGTRVTHSATFTVVGPEHKPSIFVTKSSNVATFFEAGTEITYFYQVTNDGNVTLRNIKVADNKVPAGATCPATTLAAGQSMTCTATYRVTSADVAAKKIDNRAVADGTTPAGPVVSHSATMTIPWADADVPAVSVTKTANPGSFTRVGQVITYSYLVVNNGGQTLTHIFITDNKIKNIPCKAPAVQPGQSETCTVTYTVTQADVNAGHITNTATVTGSHGNSGMPTKSLPVSATILLRPASTATTARASAVPQSPLPQVLVAAYKA